MTPPVAAAMSIVMSSCAGRRSRALRAALGSGSRCCSIAASPRGHGRGRAPRRGRQSHRQPQRPWARRSASGRSSACWRAWRWRAQQQRDQQQLIREET